jgi:hypothetical protein
MRNQMSNQIAKTAATKENMRSVGETKQLFDE